MNAVSVASMEQPHERSIRTRADAREAALAASIVAIRTPLRDARCRLLIAKRSCRSRSMQCRRRHGAARTCCAISRIHWPVRPVLDDGHAGCS